MEGGVAYKNITHAESIEDNYSKKTIYYQVKNSYYQEL